MSTKFDSFDGSKFDALVQSTLDARGSSGLPFWNFLLGNAINKYTAPNTLTPLLSLTGTTTQVPTSTNEYMQAIGTKIFSQTGCYDIISGVSTAYSGITQLNFILKVGSTYYCTANTGGSTILLGTSTDGITWTTVTFPNIGGRNPTNSVQILYDGAYLLIPVQYNGAPNAVYLLTTNDGGATWHTQNRVSLNFTMTAAWFIPSTSTVNILGNLLGNNEVASSTNYYATAAAFAFFTHTGASSGNNYKSIVLNSSQALLYYRTLIRVIDLTNTVADITYPSDASGVLYPFVDVDGTMYGYFGGIWSSTDFTNFTQLTTESSPAGAQFLNKQSQLLGGKV